MYEALLKNTPEYQKIAASLASPGPAALFGLPPAGRALLYAALQKKYSVIPTKAHDTYAITEISPKTAELLQCRKNGLVCFSRRIGYLSNEVAVEYVESFIRYDRFKLDVTIGLSGEEAQLASPVGEHVGSLYDVGIRNVLL